MVSPYREEYIYSLDAPLVVPTKKHDPLSQSDPNKIAKRIRKWPHWNCYECNTNATPERRMGPEGAKTLCNRCGLKYARDIKISKRSTPQERTMKKTDMKALTFVFKLQPEPEQAAVQGVNVHSVLPQNNRMAIDFLLN